VDNWNNITNSQNRVRKKKFWRNILFFKLSHNKVRYGRSSVPVDCYTAGSTICRDIVVVCLTYCWSIMSIFYFFLPAFVRTYNAGLCFALLFFLFLGQNTALLSNFTMLSAYCTIARQPCPAALPGSLARQPCPAALPGSLARQLCPAALPGSQIPNTAQNTALLSTFTMLSAYCTIACTLAMQPCPAAFPGSLTRQPCPAALPGSLARQPCPAALPGSLAR
jgi:hypothetical protein